MFCKNCGTQNNDEMKFCANCGIALDKLESSAERTSTMATVQAAVAVTNQKKLSPKTLRIVLPLLIVVGLILAMCVVTVSLTKPERAVENYITALVEENYSKLYDSMNIPQGEFTSKTQFIDTMERLSNRAEKDGIQNITITEATAIDLKDADDVPDYYFDKAYNVAYLTKDGAHNQKTVFLIKQGKALFFIDKYSVAPIEYLVEQYVIFAPQYVSVTFDDIPLDSSYVSKTDAKESENCYRLSNVFMGNHIITATAPFISDFETTEFATENKEARCSDFEIKPEIKAEMRKVAEDALHLFFSSNVAKKSFSEISEQLKIVPSQMDAVQKAYNSFSNKDWSGFDSRTIIYTNIELTEIQPEDANSGSLSQNIDSPLAYTVNFDVTCDVEAAPKYILWGDRHTKKPFSFMVNFSYENNELSIYSINW